MASYELPFSPVRLPVFCPFPPKKSAAASPRLPFGPVASVGRVLDRWLLSRCGLGGRRFFPGLGPAGWNGLRRAAYSAAVLPGALVVGARSLAILGNLLDYQRLSSSARLSSRQHGRLLVSLSRHSIGRARMQARNCRESEVGPPRLSIHSRASRAPLLLLPAARRQSLSRSAGSISAGSEGAARSPEVCAGMDGMKRMASTPRCRAWCH